MEIVSKYGPQRHQARFHSSVARRKLFLGGVGSGKTMCGVHEAAFLMQDNVGCDGCICSPTYQMLRDVIIPLWQTWIPERLYTLKKADQVIVWHPTGQQIFLRSADKAHRLMGLNLAWAWLDEAAQLTGPQVWRILDERIRDPSASRKCLYATTTPEGLNWIVKTFRNPASKGFIVRSKTSDNKYLDDDFDSTLRETYGEEYASQYLDAQVMELQGNVWPYLPSVHSCLSLDEMRSRCVRIMGGIDWGFTNPSALVVGGTDSDGRWYLLDMWYQRGVERDAVAQEALRLREKWGVYVWYSDHDPEGISHIRKHSRIEKAEKLVNSGVQHVRSLFPVRNDGQPRIYVAPHLADWVTEVNGYRFPEGREEPVGQSGDHALDATRYLIYTHNSRCLEPRDVALPEIRQTNQWGL